MKAKPDMHTPIGTWLIRWAGGILTKYIAGAIGKAAWERRWGARCPKPIATFGGNILHLPLTTANDHVLKGEPRMHEGIWLGINGRTGEVSVGTSNGVFKCRPWEDCLTATNGMHRLCMPCEAPLGNQSLDIIPIMCQSEFTELAHARRAGETALPSWLG